MPLDETLCRGAVRSRDARFDGMFYLGVSSTGIYCRPSCPARTPKTENMRFYASAAAAQSAGFRACKRCRPDATPGSPEWNVRSDTVARAMRLIADGVVDREGVPRLAEALGYSVRQVERLLQEELGAGPLALAQAQRAQSARTLVEATELPFADVAFAAGFSSVRAFNDVVRATYAATPTELRRAAAERDARGGAGPESGAGAAGGSRSGVVSLRLPFREPLEPSNLLGHLIATAVPGVEEYRGGAYRSTVRLPRGWGVVAVHPPAGGAFPVTLHLSDVRDLAAAVSRCRRLLDLDADPVAIGEALGADPHLRALVQESPGRRVPRTLDPEALALRAVLGQQVSTAAARTHAGRLVAALGEEIVDPDGGLTHLFPRPVDVVAAAPVLDRSLRMPESRRRTVLTMATALADGTVDLGAGADWQAVRAGLLALPGIGPWTVETVAMRALGDPDAFLPSDLGILKAARDLDLPDKVPALERASRAWSPWRAYAVQYLWATSPHAVNSLPETSLPAGIPEGVTV
ncbi:putative bifunctional transcriptional activator/DNA repair enzyme AlkA [Frondihabitans sp. 762G35]|uniref:AlkA N-terminal domain-containing protein n=1 Tax=Frondihabitans sp. 762G35 TaxID=1446794 RepID=UPI000D21A6F1|nr:AlkA N-terminal domain-containing protein [Frondihabitans sp. 762G35]ARC58503.1 putative bifunctional transcriptional activator/DNA repair enzyme AlkA [Frondihabitans sp. 762G35]